MLPPVSSMPSQRRQPPEAGAPVPAWRTLQTDEVTGFWVEVVAVYEKEKCCLTDLSVPGAAVKSVWPVTVILDSGSGISTMSESVAAKLQAAVPDVQIVAPMTDDQYVKMANQWQIDASKAEVMLRENSFTHNVGTGGDGSGVVRCFAWQGGCGDLGEPNSRGSGN